jgi:putative nucleotidyltransferase with HDIG domain
MANRIPSREDAFQLLTLYNQNESLIKHALAVEAVMRHFAALFNKDVEKWGIIGLIHDLDYEKYPDQHCKMTEKILKEEGWPEEYIESVISHGWGICTNVEPKKKMEKVLYTIDELTGLITACVLVRPSKSIMDLEVKSVKKKWRIPAFAAGVNREIIEKGAKMLGMELDDIIRETIAGMKAAAKNLDLDGE